MLQRQVLIQQGKSDSKKRCKDYDEDCLTMPLDSIIPCYTNCYDAFDGPAEGFCPILAEV